MLPDNDGVMEEQLMAVANLLRAALRSEPSPKREEKAGPLPDPAHPAHSDPLSAANIDASLDRVAKQGAKAFAEASPSQLAGLCDPVIDAAQQQEERREGRADTERMDFLENNPAKLECYDIPTGGDDVEIGWRVIEYHMSKPYEREIGRGNTARDAIDAARESGRQEKEEAK